MKVNLKILSIMILSLNYMDTTQAQQQTTCPGANGGTCPTGSYTQYCNSCCVYDTHYLYCNCQTGGYMSGSTSTLACRNSYIDLNDCGTSDISVDYTANTGGSGKLTCNNGATTGTHAHRFGLYACGDAGYPWQCGGPYMDSTTNQPESKSPASK